MTEQYDNTDKGAIWKNDDKKTETHPDFKGSLNVGGKEYWVSAWKRTGDNPKAPALKFSVTAKDEAHAQGMDKVRNQPNNAPAPSQAPTGNDLDDWDDQQPPF